MVSEPNSAAPQEKAFFFPPPFALSDWPSKSIPSPSPFPSPSKKRRVDNSPSRAPTPLRALEATHLTHRLHSTLRLRQAWADITHRHSCAPSSSSLRSKTKQHPMGKTRALREDEDDIIDLSTLEIVVDRGVLRGLRDKKMWGIGGFVGARAGDMEDAEEDIEVLEEGEEGEEEDGDDEEDWENEEDADEEDAGALTDESDEIGGWDDIPSQPSVAYTEARKKTIMDKEELKHFHAQEAQWRSSSKNVTKEEEVEDSQEKEEEQLMKDLPRALETDEEDELIIVTPQKGRTTPLPPSTTKYLRSKLEATSVVTPRQQRENPSPKLPLSPLPPSPTLVSPSRTRSVRKIAISSKTSRELDLSPEPDILQPRRRSPRRSPPKLISMDVAPPRLSPPPPMSSTSWTNTLPMANYTAASPAKKSRSRLSISNIYHPETPPGSTISPQKRSRAWHDDEDYEPSDFERGEITGSRKGAGGLQTPPDSRGFPSSPIKIAAKGKGKAVPFIAESEVVHFLDKREKSLEPSSSTTPLQRLKPVAQHSVPLRKPPSSISLRKISTPSSLASPERIWESITLDSDDELRISPIISPLKNLRAVSVSPKRLQGWLAPKLEEEMEDDEYSEDELALL